MKSSFLKNNKNESLANITIHAHTVYMQKFQILFPEPQLNKLREIAKQEDCPVSELVHSAVEFWLSRHGAYTTGNVSETPGTHLTYNYYHDTIQYATTR